MPPVRLGFMEYSEPAEWPALRCFLDDREDGVFSGLKTDRARGSFLAGRVLAKTLAGDLMGIPPKEVRIRVDEAGKPEVDRDGSGGPGDSVGPRGSGRSGGAEKSVFISITHSGGWAACACSCAAVGLDIERRCEGRNWRAVAELCFHPEEREDLMRISDAREGSRQFHRLWTVKEACIKARGLTVWDIGQLPRIRPRAEGEAGMPDALCFEPLPDLFCSIYAPGGVDYRECDVRSNFTGAEAGTRINAFASSEKRFYSV